VGEVSAAKEKTVTRVSEKGDLEKSADATCARKASPGSCRGAGAKGTSYEKDKRQLKMRGDALPYDVSVFAVGREEFTTPACLLKREDTVHLWGEGGEPFRFAVRI